MEQSGNYDERVIKDERECARFVECAKEAVLFPVPDSWGTRVMDVMIDAFQAGYEQRVPDEWIDVLRKVRSLEDREYAEYIRLKKKFEPGNVCPDKRNDMADGGEGEDKKRRF